MKRLYFVSFFVISAALLLPSCGGELTVEQTAERFLNAIKTGDKVSAKKYCIDNDKVKLDDWIGPVTKGPNSIKIISSKENGENAIVNYIEDGIEKSQTLIKENGKWKCIFNLPGLPPYNPLPKDSLENV